MPLVQEYAKKFQERYGRATDHNGIKGYIALYIVKEITERMGELNSQRLAQELHCTKITTEQEPGVLIDIVYDDKGNVDREVSWSRSKITSKLSSRSCRALERPAAKTSRKNQIANAAVSDLTQYITVMNQQ